MIDNVTLSSARLLPRYKYDCPRQCLTALEYELRIRADRGTSLSYTWTAVLELCGRYSNPRDDKHVQPNNGQLELYTRLNVRTPRGYPLESIVL